MHLKIIYFLFFQAFFILNGNKLFCQNDVPVILNYENSSGEKGISYFEYDGNQRIIKGYWQLLDSSRWSVNYYLYNKKGQLQEKYREFSDSLTSSLKYEYNSKGWKTVEDFSRSDGVNGRTNFEYNTDGVLIKISCNKYNGWFDGEIIYNPGANGNPVSGEIFRNCNKLGDIQFEYDKKDNLRIEKWITPNWSQTLEWEYIQLPVSYTSSNVFMGENNRFQLAEENYSYNHETGGPSLFNYDHLGKLTQKIFIRSDSLKTITSYEYNKNGILKNSFRKYNDGSYATFFYKFNKNRQLENRSFSHSNGTKGLERYFYSETGELIKAIWENFDNWLTGEITFEYSRNGNLKKGYFKGTEFNSNLSFKYNEFGNLTQIVWEFSFGKNQVYSFKYKDLFQKM